MTGVRLLQHAAQPGFVRIWLGFDRLVDWQQVQVLHNGVPLIAAQIVQERTASGAGRSVASRTYQIDAASGQPQDLVVTVNNVVRASARYRSSRELLPGGEFFAVLGSCFYQPECNAGHLRAALQQVRKMCGRSPDLCILMGDQVYLDLPVIKNFKNDRDWLIGKFRDDYVRNWFEYDNGNPFSELLDMAPLMMIADDHELWNNAPEKQVHIENSWTLAGRANWRAAAEALYRAFATADLNEAGAIPGMSRLRLGGVDVMTVDLRWLREARTDKGEKARLSSNPGIYTAISNWLIDSAAGSAQPVVVLGQGIFRKPTDSLKDFEQADFEEDFIELCRALAQPSQRLILLTGDVHWGRVAFARDRFSNDPLAGVYEAFVSPLALVRVPLLDALKEAFKWGSAWPRHSNPDLGEMGPFAKITKFEKPVVLPAYAVEASKQMQSSSKGEAALKGDQLAVLRVVHGGTGISADLTYISLDGKPNSGMSVRLFPR